MASGMYNSGKRALMGGDIDLVNSPVAALLVDLASYTPDLINDTSLEDIPEAAQLAEVLLTGKAIDVTTFRSDDAVFNTVPSGGTVSAVVVFKDTGSYSTSALLAFYDDSDDFPIIPNGTDISVVWGAGGIFSL